MSKFNIKTNKEPLSAKEISRKMDFDKFYSGYEAASAAGKVSRLSKTAKIFLSASAVVVVTATFVIYKAVSNKNKDTASSSFINPPIPALNYQSEAFVIDNSKDTTIVYKSGTTIYVPANAFKHKDGRNAGRTIKISYREFRDPVDFVFSGIPMEYDSAGIKSQFESAGMFEVLGYENDSVPIYLKDGKTLHVNFLSDNDENRFNVYYLDTVARRWNFEEHETRRHKEDLDRIHEEKADFLTKHGLDNPDKLIVPKKANISLDNFVIDYDAEEFPELAVYEGIKFEVSANEMNYTSDFKNTTWEDVFISRHPDGKNYILTFKLKNNKTSITAIPVFDENNFDAAMKQYEKVRLSHAKRIQAQADSLQRLDQEANAHLSRSNDVNARFNAYVQAGSVYRSIVVPTLGIWNFDRPLDNAAIYASKGSKREDGERNYDDQRENIQLPSAYFTSASTGKKILFRGVFFIRRNVNAIFPLDRQDFTRFPLRLLDNTDILIVLGNDMKVHYLKDEALHNTKVTGTEIVFIVKEISIDTLGGRSINFANTMAANLERIKSVIELQ